MLSSIGRHTSATHDAAPGGYYIEKSPGTCEPRNVERRLSQSLMWRCISKYQIGSVGCGDIGEATQRTDSDRRAKSCLSVADQTSKRLPVEVLA